MITIAGQDTRPLAGIAARWARATGQALLEGARRHRAIYALAIGTYVAAVIESLLLHQPVDWGLAGIVSSATLLLIAALVIFELLKALLRSWRSGGGERPTRTLARALFEDILTPGRISNGIHAFLALGIFTVGFTTLKTNIPRVQPFSWDATFMEMDSLLHGGNLPHDLLAPLLQHPAATFVLNVFYNLWFFMMMGFFLWQGIRDKDTPLRQRFIIAYLLCWALGTGLLGTIFSSAGPCFYGHVVPEPDPYAGLMAHLRQVNETYPIWALTAQDLLWENYVTSAGAISGISAMPSMHVGTALLFFLCARAAGIRWLSWFCALFAVAIVLGSVMLAWHYAIDAYAGALIALACWWAAGRFVSSRPS